MEGSTSAETTRLQSWSTKLRHLHKEKRTGPYEKRGIQQQDHLTCQEMLAQAEANPACPSLQMTLLIHVALAELDCRQVALVQNTQIQAKIVKLKVLPSTQCENSMKGSREQLGENRLHLHFKQEIPQHGSN